MRWLRISLLTVVPACTSLLGISDPVPAPQDGLRDAPADGGRDGAVVAESPLLVTEVVLSPNEGEFIEIFNASGQSVDLTNFFVSDHGNYFRLPAGTPTIDNGDFIARFPAGASIPAKGVVTVALATAAEFTATYGIAPSFSLADGTLTVVTVNGVGGLTSGGELAALFFWDGASDLVDDADLILAGSPSAMNAILDKSGLQQDGPDADNTPSAYTIDARTITVQMGTPMGGLSTKRIAFETGNETEAGTGNGIDGDDETSENSRMTWDSSATPFSTPTPGIVPAALLQ
ncbi:MAG: lamin tail domain-containing protein [Myxococcota bacterium]|nr:lamin tail domain-containing protein [Deltaproteobacteria bacterium]MDQ3339077.1 lamin tail domain-containing protein [Myxococcota bacterium]